MTTATKRRKLHDFINMADDGKVEAIYSMIKDEIAESVESTQLKFEVSKLSLMKQASADPLFLADLKEVSEDFAVADKENL